MDCPSIPHLGYGAFSERLHTKLSGKRVPLAGSIELTFRCNLQCAHCYLGSYPGGPGQTELSTAEFCGILDEVVEAGCLWMLFTGGEPLVRATSASSRHTPSARVCS